MKQDRMFVDLNVNGDTTGFFWDIRSNPTFNFDQKIPYRLRIVNNHVELEHVQSPTEFNEQKGRWQAVDGDHRMDSNVIHIPLTGEKGFIRLTSVPKFTAIYKDHTSNPKHKELMVVYGQDRNIISSKSTKHSYLGISNGLPIFSITINDNSTFAIEAFVSDLFVVKPDGSGKANPIDSKQKQVFQEAELKNLRIFHQLKWWRFAIVESFDQLVQSSDPAANPTERKAIIGICALIFGIFSYFYFKGPLPLVPKNSETKTATLPVTIERKMIEIPRATSPIEAQPIASNPNNNIGSESQLTSVKTAPNIPTLETKKSIPTKSNAVSIARSVPISAESKREKKKNLEAANQMSEMLSVMKSINKKTATEVKPVENPKESVLTRNNLGSIPSSTDSKFDSKTLAKSGMQNQPQNIGNIGARGYEGSAVTNASASGKGLVRIGSEHAEVATGLTKEEVGKVIQDHFREIRFCHENYLASHPSSEGMLKISFTIGGTQNSLGKVIKSKTEESQFSDQELANCIQKQMSNWKFPAPRGSVNVDVTYPFSFRMIGKE